MLELASAFTDGLPVKTVTVLKTGPTVLERLTAACQFTQSISVGFVESLLPDPRGFHVDYERISNGMHRGSYMLQSPWDPDNSRLIIFRQATVTGRHPKSQPTTFWNLEFRSAAASSGFTDKMHFDFTLL
jgi:hypothetical protein